MDDSVKELRFLGDQYRHAQRNFGHQASLCRGTLSASCNLVADSEYGILAKYCRGNPDKANEMIDRVSKRLGRKPLWCK